MFYLIDGQNSLYALYKTMTKKEFIKHLVNRGEKPNLAKELYKLMKETKR